MILRPNVFKKMPVSAQGNVCCTNTHIIKFKCGGQINQQTVLAPVCVSLSVLLALWMIPAYDSGFNFLGRIISIHNVGQIESMSLSQLLFH